MTALSPGQTYSIALAARDLASNTRNASVTHTSPALAYQADAPDIGYFSSGPNGVAQFRTGTQMYAGTAYVDPLDTVAQRHLGAWMFRVPQAVDPNTITGAVVETTSRHNWVVQYTADPQFTVDLLNESVEPNWGTQNYDAIRTAPHTARVFPETGYERGGGQTYAFTFNCSDIAALRSSLSTVDGGERKAAFRYEATQTEAASLLAMDFGFNRRSSGPAYRPRLLLFTGTSYPTGEGCDANAPAPVINDIGIQDGLTDGSVTVTWRTDNVASDSMVLFRERGTTQWTQVGTPARTRVHQVQVQGLDSSKFYEFVVRSRACNGATTTDTNNGAGYDFFRHAPDPGPRTQHGSTFDFETGAAGLDGRRARRRIRPGWRRSGRSARPEPKVPPTGLARREHRDRRPLVPQLQRDDPDRAGAGHVRRRAGVGRVLDGARLGADVRLPLRRVLDERRGLVDGGGALRREQRPPGVQPDRRQVREPRRPGSRPLPLQVGRAAVVPGSTSAHRSTA